MISAIPTPPLFAMAPPFDDMDGKRIRVIEDDRTSVGEIHVSKRPAQGLFGIRVDILGAADDAGRFTIRYLTLPEHIIKAIERTEDRDVPYQVRVG